MRLRAAVAVWVGLTVAGMAGAATDPLGPAFVPAMDTNPGDYPANVCMSDTMTKLRQDSGTCSATHWGTFWGTQNEFIDFQVHYHDNGPGTANLSVTVGDLVQVSPGSATIPAATSVLVFREGYMNVTTPTATGATYYNAAGWYPDAAIPTVDPYHAQTTNAFPVNVAGGQNQSAWVDVHVPPNAPTGYYLGAVTVRSGGTVLATMPVTIAVWQWPTPGGMPSTSSLHFQTRAYAEDLCKQVYGVASCASYPGSGGSDSAGSTLTQIDLGRNLLDHRIGSANYYQPGYTTSFAGLETSYGPLLNGTVNTLLSGAKITAAEYFNNTFPVSFTNVGNWATEANTHGWFGAFIVNTFDEPSTGGAWSTIISAGATAHATTPPSPAAVTTNIAAATSNGALNAIDILIPKINDLDPRGGSLQRSAYNTWLAGNAGPVRQLWSYQSCSSAGTCANGTTGPSTATWPNMNVDGKPAANRAMEWLTFLHGQTGELYYAVADCFADSTCTGNAPWTSVYAYGGWGDGTLFYPGDSGHVGGGVTTPIWVPSIRLKHIRDGLQDYEYLAALTAAGKGATVTTQIASWITNSYTFETSGTGLQSARQAIGAAVHALTYQGGGTGTDVYVTPAGSAIAPCTVNPHPPSWFNSAANWGTGAGQIGPGVTVHLCGTFTSASGATILAAQGSGTAVAPITILFESGAVLQSPAFSGGGNGGGALVIGGHSYLVVDGGTNGLIQNTNAGTNLGNDTLNFQSLAVNAGTNNVRGCTPGCRVTNLTVANMYVHVYTGIGAPDSLPDQQSINAITVDGADGIRIDHNTFHDMGWAVSYICNNLEMDHNNIYNVDHGIAAGAQANMSGAIFHDNHIHDFANWDTGFNCSGCNHYHHDGIHLWAFSPWTNTGFKIYNNRFDGNAGVNKNGWIYTEGFNAGTQIFNNVMAETVIAGQDGIQPIWLAGTNNIVVNNTIYGAMTGVAGFQFFTMTNLVFKNNIVDGPNTFFYGGHGTIAATIAGMDFNTYGPRGAGGNNGWHVTDSGVDTSDIATWRAASGFDGNSTMNAAHTVNPDGSLVTGSPAIGAGTNLTSLGIAALNADINGVARPASGAWTNGAAVSGAPPPPPVPGISIAPGTVAFGNQTQNVTSAPLTVTVSSTGTAPLVLGSSFLAFGGANGGDWTRSGGTCANNQPVAAGTSCTVLVVFRPVTIGAETGTLSVTSNAAGSPTSVNLTGTGVAAAVPCLSVAPARWDFGNVPVGTFSATQTFVLTNCGTTALTLSSPVTTLAPPGGDFSLPGGDTCTGGLVLAPGGTCTKFIRGNPSAAGARSGSATLSATTVSAIPIALVMTGTVATTCLSIAPTPTMAFGAVVQGQPSSVTTATVTNCGTVAVTLATPNNAVTGANAADFVDTTTGSCRNALLVAAGGTCTLQLVFTPGTAGAESATLTVNGSGAATVATGLAGSGVAPSPTPAPIPWIFVMNGCISYGTRTRCQMSLPAAAVLLPGLAKGQYVVTVPGGLEIEVTVR